MRDNFRKAWDETPNTNLDYAPGQNADQDTRDQAELSSQQKARQKFLSGQASNMLSSFQNAQTSKPNLASRMLMGTS